MSANQPTAAAMRVILVTGMSGSGKSVALNVLEDAGYAVVDNLPTKFLVDVVSDLRDNGQQKVALSIDVRTGVDSITQLPLVLPSLRRFGVDLQVLLLTADTPTLVARFSETRRRHPLSDDRAERTLEECIAAERQILGAMDGLAQVLDTSGLRAQTLRSWVRDFVGRDGTGLTLLFESFAFKNGVPMDADLVFDVRCLPNPHYDPVLRPLTGKDQPVIDFLAELPDVRNMIEDIRNFVARWLPAYVQDNRSYLTVAVGCTGGQHRSVYCVEQLARRFRAQDHVLIRHRVLDSGIR